MRAAFRLTLLGVAALTAAPAHAQPSQEALRERQFLVEQLARQRAEFDRQQAQDRARIDQLIAENAQSRALLEQILARVTAPRGDATLTEARENETEARYAAGALIAEGDANERRAAELIAAGDLDAGFALLRQSAEASVNDAAERWRRLGALAYDRDVRNALHAYTQASALDPDNPDTLTRLCMLQARAGTLQAARGTCDRAITAAVTDLDRYNANYAAGRVGYWTADPDAAESRFRQARAIAESLFNADPSVEHALRLAHALTQLRMSAAGRGDETVRSETQQALRMLAAQPARGLDADTRDAVILRSYFGEARASAVSAGRADLLAEAVREMQALHQALPEDSVVTDRLANVRALYGEALYAAGEHEAAVREFDAAAALAGRLVEGDRADADRVVRWIEAILGSVTFYMAHDDWGPVHERLVRTQAVLDSSAVTNGERSILELMRPLLDGWVAYAEFKLARAGRAYDHDPVERIEDALARIEAQARQPGHTPHTQAFLANGAELMRLALMEADLAQSEETRQ